jgi:hypothetical protein
VTVAVVGRLVVLATTASTVAGVGEHEQRFDAGASAGDERDGGGEGE